MIAKKKEIIEKKERNEDEIRESLRDMEDCDKILEGRLRTNILKV